MPVTAHTRLLLIALLLVLVGFSNSGATLAQSPTPSTTAAAGPTSAAGANATLSGEQRTATRDTTSAAPIGENTPPVTNDPTAIELGSTMAFLIVLALLALLVFALWRLFDYLRDSRDDYYRTVREFARKGIFFNPVFVESTSAAKAGTESTEREPTNFTLVGPGVVATGQNAIFKALADGTDDPNAMWQVEPPTGAGLEDAGATITGSGASITVQAAKQGAFVLVASHPGAQTREPALSVRTQVTVVEQAAQTDEVPHLPFIGQGYGSLVGAVVLIAALVVLAATRAIDADVVGVILGALAGYLFGVGAVQGRS